MVPVDSPYGFLGGVVAEVDKGQIGGFASSEEGVEVPMTHLLHKRLGGSLKPRGHVGHPPCGCALLYFPIFNLLQLFLFFREFVALRGLDLGLLHFVFLAMRFLFGFLIVMMMIRLFVVMVVIRLFVMMMVILFRIQNLIVMVVIFIMMVLFIGYNMLFLGGRGGFCCWRIGRIRFDWIVLLNSSIAFEDDDRWHANGYIPHLDFGGRSLVLVSNIMNPNDFDHFTGGRIACVLEFLN